MSALPVPTDEPQLDLVFGAHPLAGTRLTRRRTRYPFVLTSAFRLDDHPADMLTTIVQSASGAILGEDRLVQRITVGAGANAHITTQAAMAVHRMPAGMIAEESIAIDVAAGALAEYLPAPRILFPDAALRQRLILTVDPAATAVVADGFVAHDPDATSAEAVGGLPRAHRHFRLYAGEIEIRRPDGALLAVDRFELAAPGNRFGRAASLRAHGSLIVATPGSTESHAALAAALDASLLDIDCLAAATLLPRGAGVALRIAATDGARLRAATTAAWTAARLILTGSAPSRRRY
ncbi:urease accessory protein UreD [Chthonobacter albigriseus]|uniref:urease accessory protein UreD n=1 Tax=Chthonobacter albigriseus TaxID=1683161 RepID=UPI0015EEF094